MPTFLQNSIATAVVLASAVVATLGTAVAAPATVRFVPGSSTENRASPRMAAVEVDGEITPDTPEQLRAALADGMKKTNMRHDGGSPMLPVHLNSPGGDVVAAMKMGELVRQMGASTWIRPKARCASACVLVFAAGVERLLFDDSRIGIHRPYFPPERFATLDRLQAQSLYTTLEQQVAGYLRRMGITDALFNEMMQVPSNKLRWLGENEAIKMRLVGQDPGFAEWDRAKMKERYLPEYVDWKDKFDDCIKTLSTEECIRRNPPPSKAR